MFSSKYKCVYVRQLYGYDIKKYVFIYLTRLFGKNIFKKNSGDHSNSTCQTIQTAGISASPSSGNWCERMIHFKPPPAEPSVAVPLVLVQRRDDDLFFFQHHCWQKKTIEYICVCLTIHIIIIYLNIFCFFIAPPQKIYELSTFTSSGLPTGAFQKGRGQVRSPSQDPRVTCRAKHKDYSSERFQQLFFGACGWKMLDVL